MRTRAIVFLVAVLALFPHGLRAAPVSCPDGEFHPLASLTCDTTLNPDGVFNFTSVTIPVGVTVGFARNTLNMPITLKVAGDVSIAGTIDVSAAGRTGGPSGGDGGLKGEGIGSGSDGGGLSPGKGGAAGSPNPGHAGGGGGIGTAGTEASRHTAVPPAAGGSAIPFPDPLQGGSGGGGGGGWTLFGVALSGGDGGGAGGAIRIETPGVLTISGRIVTNGTDGGWSFANAFGFGGPGGGGSGGVIDLEASLIVLTGDGRLEALGGKGGGISTMPIWHPEFSSLANGGMGYARFHAPALRLSGSIAAVPVFSRLDPFLCYTAVATRGSARFVPPPPITLADSLETRVYDVRRPTSLCAPLSKNGEVVNDPDTHLEGYAIAQARTTPAQPRHQPQTGVTVMTQFGTIVVDTTAPDEVLVPTAKCVESSGSSCPDPLPPPEPGTHDVEHFRCYGVRVSARSERFQTIRGVLVVDQFIEESGRRFDLTRPSRLCRPADKNGEGLSDATTNLMCFQARAVRGEPRFEASRNLHVSNQFGEGSLDATREDELCLPAAAFQ